MICLTTPMLRVHKTQHTDSLRDLHNVVMENTETLGLRMDEMLIKCNDFTPRLTQVGQAPTEKSLTLRICLTQVKRQKYYQRLYLLLLMLPNDWAALKKKIRNNYKIRRCWSCSRVCVCPQVANLNPKDNSYTLKDFVYREVQRDWPGYSEDDRVQVNGILAR